MYQQSRKATRVTAKQLTAVRNVALSAMFLGATTLLAPIVNAAGDLKTGFVPGRTYCNNFAVPNVTSDGLACITLITNSTGRDDVETMLFFTNDGSAKVNVTTTLNVSGAAQNGSATGTYSPGVATRTGWKTTAAISSSADTVGAVFTLNGQVIDTVSGQ